MTEKAAGYIVIEYHDYVMRWFDSRSQIGNTNHKNKHDKDLRWKKVM